MPTPRPPTPPSLTLGRPKHPPPTKEEWNRRYCANRVLFITYPAIVTGFPSSGGVLTLAANGVDLEYLGVSRAEPTPRPVDVSPEDEDAWCNKIRRLAPKWYRSLGDKDVREMPHELTQSERDGVYVGFNDEAKGGGVWVLRCKDGRQPEDFGRYHVSLSMEERCRALETLGATRYENVEDVEELDERYEQRMRMERDELEERYGPFVQYGACG